MLLRARRIVVGVLGAGTFVVAAACTPGTAAVSGNETAAPPPQQQPRQTSNTPQRRALLVGVSQYARGGPLENAWWNLHSEPDVKALHDVLVNRFQFADNRINVLTTPERTTHEAVVNAFRALIAETNPGDIVYFHYSGHGKQIPDDNGDELDGLDESLIPSDYVSRQDGSRNIRDDEVSRLLSELKVKRPASVTLSFDTCFSGTITRGGTELIRGEMWTGPVPKAPATGALPKGPGGILKRGEAESNGYVVISATRSDQLANETEYEPGKSMGLFSNALAHALVVAGARTTYRDLFEIVADEMTGRHRDQDLQMEGQLDQVLMSGTALPAEAYVPVRVQDGSILLDAGRLHRVTSGSRFALYAAGTKNFHDTKPIAEADVADVDLTVAKLALVAGSNVKLEALHSARAVEKTHTFADESLRVDLGRIAALPRVGAIREQLKTLPLVRTDLKTGEPWDARLCVQTCPDEVPPVRGERPSRGAGTLVLQRQDGHIIQTVEDREDAAVKLRAALEGEGRWRFVKALKNDDPVLRVQLQVVPIEPVLDARGYVQQVKGDKPPRRAPGGQQRLARGDYFMIELRNTGTRDAYVTVLELRNDGRIGPIWPHPKAEKVVENKIAADNKWHRIQLPFVFRVTEKDPIGLAVLKAIATSDPTDFSSLVDPVLARGPATGKGADSPLGQLLWAVARAQGTRSDFAGKAINPSNWSTAAAAYEVVEK